jgi:chromosome segregation ATPase
MAIREILQYLIEYPNAKDTLQGILRWWLPGGETEGTEEEVQESLDILVARGWLTQRHTSSSHMLYGMNIDKLEEIEKFLQEDRPMANEQDVFNLLYEHWKQVLDKELELLDKDRPVERKLLEQQIKDWQRYATTQDDLVSLTELDYSQEELGRAKDWLYAQKARPEEEKGRLQERLKRVQSQIETQEAKIKRWEDDLRELLGRLRALPTEIEQAEQQVQQLQSALDDARARGFEPRIRMLERSLTAAQSELEYLRDHTENVLREAIDEALHSVKQARDDLKGLMVETAGGQESLEELEIQIKQVEKKLQYLQQQEEVFIRRYLEQQEGSNGEEKPNGEETLSPTAQSHDDKGASSPTAQS